MNQGANICKKNKRVVPLDMNFAYVVIWGRSSHMDGDNSVVKNCPASHQGGCPSWRGVGDLGGGGGGGGLCVICL